MQPCVPGLYSSIGHRNEITQTSLINLIPRALSLAYPKQEKRPWKGGCSLIGPPVSAVLPFMKQN